MKIIFAFVTLLSISQARALERVPFMSCRFENAPTVIEKADSLLLQSWDFTDDHVATAGVLPHDPAFILYRKQVSSAITTRPLELLTRYAAVSPNAGDAQNLKIVAGDVAHYIHPINCIEALLIDQQIRRTPAMLTAPTEFLAIFLKNTDGRLRVYFLTDDINGVRNMDTLLSHVTADVAAGWTVTGNLHNHSFWLNNLTTDQLTHPQGVLAPSATDIQMFRATKEQFNLPSASITNGFDTVTVSANEFSAFIATDPTLSPTSSPR